MTSVDFPTFGFEHNIYLLASFILWLGIPFFGRKFLTKSQQMSVAITLIVITLLHELQFDFFQLYIDDFDLGDISDGMKPLFDAVVLATIASYAQGMDILREASAVYNYGLNMPSIAQIWKGGCIIRSKLLSKIQDAYNKDPNPVSYTHLTLPTILLV